ncbi:MAG: hypothetical protein EHM84_05655 [Lysobacterales bacterium]|nr:MAG: hypothetical protein EHM84_05655 [Xanthomonadales bacterium]
MCEPDIAAAVAELYPPECPGPSKKVEGITPATKIDSDVSSCYVEKSPSTTHHRTDKVVRHLG